MEVPISRLAIRTALVAASVAVHSASADTPDELLEYVESTGTQYIDTGIVGKSGTKASMQMMWTKNESDKSFLAARKSSSERFFLLHRYNATHIYAGYWGKTSQIIEISENNVYSVITEVKTDGTYTVSANGTSKTLDTSGVGAKNTGYSLYLFAMNNAGSPAYYSSSRCYGTKIWQIPDGGTGYALVRDFVPCKKGESGWPVGSGVRRHLLSKDGYAHRRQHCCSPRRTGQNAGIRGVRRYAVHRHGSGWARWYEG